MKRFFESGYYKLTRQVFKGVFLRVMVMCAALIVLTFAKLIGSVNLESFTQPYEALISASGIATVFFGAVGVFMLLLILQIFMDIHRNKGYAVVMMLPMPRRHVLFAYCTAGVIGILMLWAVQTLALILAYGPVTAACESTAVEYERVYKTVLPFAMARTNGLFLAVVRGDLFHILLPMGIPEALSSLLLIFTAGCLPAYGLLGEKKHIAVVTMLLTFVLLIFVVTQRMNSMWGIELNGFVWRTVLMGLALVYMLAVSVYRLNRSANVV